jgi:1-acyl-sn-glycerol-3-phosphate acyltransferase
MIHIDRKLRSQAFQKVVSQGKALLDRGVWVIMFPEGTRIDRGQAGVYKSGGTRLAIETGVPVITHCCQFGALLATQGFGEIPRHCHGVYWPPD